MVDNQMPAAGQLRDECAVEFDDRQGEVHPVDDLANGDNASGAGYGEKKPLGEKLVQNSAGLF